MDKPDQISVGPWTISAGRTRDGTLSIEVLLGDVPHANFELDEGGIAGESRATKLERQSKLETDIDY